MASSRRASNGRSPLVNPQRQITSFFSKKTTSPSPSPALSNSGIKPETNPSPSPIPDDILDPTTPSPPQSKTKKPLLVIGRSPSSASTPATDSVKKSYGPEAVDKRIKVYWPLDKSWYEGYVKSFDGVSGKHLVQYDDADEELLNLAEEKIEFVVEPAKRFRRLRRFSLLADEEEEEKEEKLVSDGDDSQDKDSYNNVEKGKSEDVSEDMDLDCDEEEVLSGKKQKETKTKKRKTEQGDKSDSSKKSNAAGGLNKGVTKCASDAKVEQSASVVNNILVGDAAERFGMREAEKLWFLGKERRDACQRRPGDDNYDCRTLYLPPTFLKGLTGGQRQWWDFKSKHMDKVLFFKMGKFYELFEMDAHIGVKELDLQYMKGEQPHCGFPEKNFSVNVKKLAQKGYRVLVVEQTETPEQLELRRKEKGCKDKVVKREICAVVTKGTLTDEELLSANPDACYLMALTENCQSFSNLKERVFGICVVDVATSRIILGQFNDDSECSALCFLLSELRPVEIIKPAKLLSSETEKVLLRNTRNPVVNELIPCEEFWDARKTVSEVMNFYKNLNEQSVISCTGKDAVVDSLPTVVSELIESDDDGNYALSALGGAVFYLKQAFLHETLLKFAKFELLSHFGWGNVSPKPYMVLDAAALENLEIFENCKNGDATGTLYAQINHCVTAFGKRLLKAWLARPLYNLESIGERQDALRGLKENNLASALDFRKELSRLPDMERLLARIFAISEASGRNANKVVLYEDAAKKQLQEFISLLRGCELMFNSCSLLGSKLNSIDSKLLRHLLTPGNGLPDVHSLLKHFKDAFDWEEANDSGRIVPREGADLEYDFACKTVREIESQFSKHLKEQRKILGDASINYVTIGKDAYLLEVPESICGSISKDYELQSSKKGFFRYWTPVIKKLKRELSEAESEKQSKMKNIFQRLVGRFCEHHDKWRQLVSTTAEVDVLISLAIVNDYYEGPTCRPTCCPTWSDELPCLVAKNLGHPVLRSDTLGKGSFVPNDVCIGGSSNSSFLLLTGPNMGGKSTLLRQVCLAVILAQIGADVPAESFVLSPVDRIFVRMGAKDHIMASQSTFLTELLETATMLSLATRNSLVALDELGRGTSTSDGQAIAESVLKHFLHEVSCRGLFSTHYHRLAIDHQRDPKISLCHMACQVGKGLEGLEEVTFLYRLIPGACPKSYGVNVARLAGLPDDVLRRAVAKSQEFELIYDKRANRTGENLPSQCWEGKATDLVRNVLDFVTRTDHQESDSAILCSLNELQHGAKILLGQS